MAAVVGEVYCFDAIVDDDDGDNSDDIRTVRRWGYCKKEEKEGSAAASEAPGGWRFNGLIGGDDDDIQMLGDGAIRGVLWNKGIRGAV